MFEDNQNTLDEVMDILNKMISNLPIGVYIKESDTGKIISCNEKFVQIYNYTSKEEILGKISWDFFLNLDDIKKCNEKLVKEGFFNSELATKTKNEQKIMIDLMMINLPKIPFIMGLVRDITDHWITETKLRESEAKYRALVETIQEGIIIVDSLENIVFVNPAFCKNLGYNKTELIGKNLKDLIDPEKHELFQSQIEKCKRGEFGNYRIKLIEKENYQKEFLISNAPLFDSKSFYAGTLATCVDLTKYHYINEEEIRINEYFLNILMKETSNQVLRAGGWLDIVLAELKERPDQIERIEKARFSLQKVDNLSKQIKMLLKHDTSLPLSYISCSEFIDFLNLSLKPVVESKGCIFKTNCSSDISTVITIPILLKYALELIIHDSLNRNSLSIQCEISKALKGEIQIQIIDNGLAFFDDGEKSGFLLSFYLADAILRNIGGELHFKPILLGEGLQITLIFPENKISYKNS